ncbi:MAG TPA: hypothetical protein VFN02_13815, partial [Ktedonobacteraceae bacterium]|nr:hypothetical protein [Ktedonobacteraceae bacterium]
MSFSTFYYSVYSIQALPDNIGLLKGSGNAFVTTTFCSRIGERGAYISSLVFPIISIEHEHYDAITIATQFHLLSILV